MRTVRLVIVIIVLSLIVVLEHAHPLAPFTWICLVLFSVRVRLPFLLMVACTLFADLALSAPLGASALVCAGLISIQSFAPKRLEWRVLFFALLGVGVGAIYGVLIQGVNAEMILVSSVTCAVLYSLGNTFASIEEIGNVQN